MRKRALVTGCTGQTGSYLCELLVGKDYDVFGMVRRTSSSNMWRLTYLLGRLTLLEGDLLDESSLRRVIEISQPAEVYNFAAQSHVGVSFLEPIHTSDVTGIGALRLFEALRISRPGVRIYQASSSEQYGQSACSPQTEETPMHPVSPYGAAKLFAHTIAHVYRQAYDMHIACGIAFNHESPRRSEEFVTRKITRSLALIRTGQLETFRLGNLDIRRDWSHAQDIARGAWQLLQYRYPEDVVFASGASHSLQEFLDVACQFAGVGNHGIVKSDLSLYRPADVSELVGSPKKAQQVLGWKPLISFSALVKEMVDADLALVGISDSGPSTGLVTPDAAALLSRSADVPEGAA